MLLDGYLRAEVGGDQRVRTGAGSSDVPEDILDGGPILTFRGGEARTRSVPDKTIALTFDDGPNPTWTPEILEVLKKYDIPATFFVVGSMVSRYPTIVEDMVESGHEIGIHTFTHVDLSYQSDARVTRVTREMTQTQLALAGAALSLAALGFGAWYAFTHQEETGSYDLDDSPLAQAFFSAGFVTLLLYAKAYFKVDFAGLTPFPRLDRIVTVFDSRAVTIYLWHEIALILAVPLIDEFWNVPAFEKHLPLESQWLMFGLGWLLIGGFVLLCGWVEDVAAGKKPKLLP